MVPLTFIAKTYILNPVKINSIILNQYSLQVFFMNRKPALFI
jgi:hypothetical protein